MTRRRPVASTTSRPLAGVTAWRHVTDEIERAIAHGEFAAGERLPSETDVAQRFGVHRHTVRRALAELAGRGLVRAERGSGTFVKTGRLPYPIRQRTRFSDIVGAAGRDPGGRLVGHATEPAQGEIARRLELPVGAPVIRLDIVRSVDGVPVSFGTTWLSADLVPDAVRIFRATRSMTRTLARAGINDYRRRESRISASIADATDAARLRLAPGRPLIVVDSIDVTLADRPVLTTRARLAADRIELIVET
jgi:GntR family transcriptional regulator, phosphonate transport system regulatory protein